MLTRAGRIFLIMQIKYATFTVFRLQTPFGIIQVFCSYTYTLPRLFRII
ncbi:hypothetical protein DFP91_2275 [Pseudorhodoplanes sinuspersici]|nr:hypothetical protein DFP91_2275 [Pseudorhodoplanes sinuspersici]